MAVNEFERFKDIVAKLRSEEGCPWDRAQTHESLKPTCIEEAAEVICGINILSETGNADNLKEELGDLLMQVVIHAQIAQEEGLFTMDDIIRGISEKMIRRHPHVFHKPVVDKDGKELTSWDDIKRFEKEGKEGTDEYLPGAFEEAKELIERAKKRKGYK